MASSPSLDTANNEQMRLNVLCQYTVLATGAEWELDQLVQRAAQDCGYPTGLITLMGEHHCWFKATTGLLPDDWNRHELPREQTFCNYAFRSSGIFVVSDARTDPRFQHLSVVDRPDGYRAYVGAPLITPDGYSIGTLCLLDTEPRTPTPQQMDTLRSLAARTMTMLEQRRRAPAAPSVRPAAPAVPAPVAPPAAAPGAARDLVLVVDDEDMVRGVTAAMVTRLGYEARLASNGVEALERIAALGGRVRLVVTDVNMPTMNGVELSRALRSQANAPAVVAMSGKFSPDVRKALQAEGVTHLIEKPFGLPEIAAALKKYLPVVR